MLPRLMASAATIVAVGTGLRSLSSYSLGFSYCAQVEKAFAKFEEEELFKRETHLDCGRDKITL